MKNETIEQTGWMQQKLHDIVWTEEYGQRDSGYFVFALFSLFIF